MAWSRAFNPALAERGILQCTPSHSVGVYDKALGYGILLPYEYAGVMRSRVPFSMP